MDSIIETALAATTVAKTLVDLLRMATDTPRWVPPLAALFCGIISVLLLEIASKVALSADVLATVILAGIVSGGLSVGVTELQKRAVTAGVTRAKTPRG